MCYNFLPKNFEIFRSGTIFHQHYATYVPRLTQTILSERTRTKKHSNSKRKTSQLPQSHNQIPSGPTPGPHLTSAYLKRPSHEMSKNHHWLSHARDESTCPRQRPPTGGNSLWLRFTRAAGYTPGNLLLRCRGPME